MRKARRTWRARSGTSQRISRPSSPIGNAWRRYSMCRYPSAKTRWRGSRRRFGNTNVLPAATSRNDLSQDATARDADDLFSGYKGENSGHKVDITGSRDCKCLIIGAPYGIRTRVTALRGPCPRPLDEGSGVLRFWAPEPKRAGSIRANFLDSSGTPLFERIVDAISPLSNPSL